MSNSFLYFAHYIFFYLKLFLFLILLCEIWQKFVIYISNKYGTETVTEYYQLSRNYVSWTPPTLSSKYMAWVQVTNKAQQSQNAFCVLSSHCQDNIFFFYLLLIHNMLLLNTAAHAQGMLFLNENHRKFAFDYVSTLSTLQR